MNVCGELTPTGCSGHALIAIFREPPETVTSGPSAASRAVRNETYQVDRRDPNEHTTPQSVRTV